MIHYESATEFTKKLADDCGGCKDFSATYKAADQHDTVADTCQFDTESTQNLADNLQECKEIPATIKVAGQHDAVADTQQSGTEFTQNLADSDEEKKEIPVTCKVDDHDNTDATLFGHPHAAHSTDRLPM